MSSYYQNLHKAALTLIILSGLVPAAQAASPPPGARNFQMALWTDENSPPVDSDVGHFNQEDGQPSAPTLSVLEFFPNDTKVNDPDSAKAWNAMVGRNNYDFGRILAVVVDEPYLVVGPAPSGSPLWQNPCHDSRGAKIPQLYANLRALAQAVKNTSPRTRFWINFSEAEVQWMKDPACPLTLNGSFADVVSLDKYHKPFPGPCQIVLTQEAPCVQPYYDWFLGHLASAGQQIALVPGTFVRTQNGIPLEDANQQASLLVGFFDYANDMNQTCNFPVGNSGVTTNFDRCPVWMVVGFPGQSFTDTTSAPPELWHGELDTDPLVQPVQAAWRAELALFVRRPIDASIIEMVNEILFNDED